jgi:hypothetical protein
MPFIQHELCASMRVFDSLYRAYPGFWNAAHCCLPECIGVLCKLRMCKKKSQAAFLETDRRSVPSNAGLRDPCPVLRLIFFSSTTTTTVELTQRPLPAAPRDGARRHSGRQRRPRAGELACTTGRQWRARGGLG